MILVTGGLGFIGAHTTRALLDLGEDCVVGRFQVDRRPPFLNDDVGTRLFVEPLDCTDLDALRTIGKRYPVTGIVHLAGVRPGSMPVVDELQSNVTAMLNVLRVAAEWSVPRVTLASTIGVYGGVDAPVWPESAPLPMTSAHTIPAAKKASEVLAGVVASAGGFEAVHVRIGAIWGPLGRARSLFIAAPALVHAAVHAADPGQTQAYADDTVDLCYVRDCGRAIALIQTTDRLQHATYNVGSGTATTNARFCDALRAVVPETRLNLRPGRGPNAVPDDPYLDITRLRTDTGYEPIYDLDAAVADYISWLRAGNPL
jgi:UDP-glucose 4-epimerase